MGIKIDGFGSIFQVQAKRKMGESSKYIEELPHQVNYNRYMNTDRSSFQS